MEDNVPFAMFGGIGTELTDYFANKMNIERVSNVDSFSLQPVHTDEMIGFEAKAPPRIDRFSMAIKSKGASNTRHLTYGDNNNKEIDMVITGPWGGLALYPTIQDVGLDPISDWIVDPFNFLKTALKLPDLPMPDITSENGTRLWFSHIDGDAMPSWAELPGRFLGSEIIRDRIIKHYKLPHTISVVEAEMYTEGREGRMQQTARDLFALDYVEIATHTYSHPFHWQALKRGSPSGIDNLKIDGYLFDLDREIGGSARYIDCLLYTSPSPRDRTRSRMPSSA